MLQPRRVSPPAPVRPRNDPAQYDDLADEWWAPRGRFAMLAWINAARARLVPPARRPDAVLLDVACGGGLLAPYVAGKGYRHVGVDLSPTAARTARAHGVDAVRGDALALPLADASADVVVAGEVLEHVPDVERAIAEACRVLKPGGRLVLDTVADTWWARFLVVTVGERLPAGPPPRLHDPALFVDRERLRQACARHGIPALRLQGLRPGTWGYLLWLVRRRAEVPMVATRVTAALFQAWGDKAGREPR